MVFLALEGFSATGKTVLAKGLEDLGWLRMTESAHAVSSNVPVADRADTFADFSLLGATLQYCSMISQNRATRNIVAEGYLLGDLAYAKVRYELNKSDAFPAMLSMVKSVLAQEAMRPDLYIILKALPDTINGRQQSKDAREKNLTEFFQTRYYTAIKDLHHRLDQQNVEVVLTDGDVNDTLAGILKVLREKGFSWEKL